MNDSFVVYYRTGGTHKAEWRDVWETYSDRATATAKADEISRMGYKAVVNTARARKSLGLPIGWCPKCDGTTGQCRFEVGSSEWKSACCS
jgi:hypothetical protein